MAYAKMQMDGVGGYTLSRIASGVGFAAMGVAWEAN
jgi:hypothetical protein